MNRGMNDFETSLKALTDGQRRYVANSLKFTDPGLSSINPANKELMFSKIAESQDSAAAEYLIKDTKTDDMVKSKLREQILAAKLINKSASELKGFIKDTNQTNLSTKGQVAMSQIWKIPELATILSASNVAVGASTNDKTILSAVVAEYEKIGGRSSKDSNMAKFYNNQKRYITGTDEQERAIEILDPEK
jgi:hypothetical protein